MSIELYQWVDESKKDIISEYLFRYIIVSNITWYTDRVLIDKRDIKAFRITDNIGAVYNIRFYADGIIEFSHLLDIVTGDNIFAFESYINIHMRNDVINGILNQMDIYNWVERGKLSVIKNQIQDKLGVDIISINYRMENGNYLKKILDIDISNFGGYHIYIAEDSRIAVITQSQKYLDWDFAEVISEKVREDVINRILA